MSFGKEFKKPLAAVCFASVLVLTGCGGSEERMAEYLSRAQASLDAEDYEKARIDIKNALQIDVNNAQGFYMMALVEEKEQNWRAVFGNLSKAVEIAPDHVPATVKLAQLNMLASNEEEALRLVEHALKLAPEDADALATRATIALRADDKQLAEEYALASLAVDAGQSSAIAVMVSLFSTDNPEKARTVLLAGREAAPESDAVRLLLIRFLDAQGDTQGAIAEYEAIIASKPDEFNAVGQLIEYYVSKEMYDEAEVLLVKAIGDFPDDLNAKLSLVRFQGRFRDADKSHATLVDMLKEQPEEFELRDALGKIEIALKKNDKAKAVYLETFNYSVDGSSSIEARNRLADIAMMEGDIEEARKWIGEVLEIEAENPDALLKQSKIKIEAGNFKEAIPDLRMVLRSAPDSIPALLLLADAQVKDRAIGLALDNYQKVLALAPRNRLALYQSARLLAGQQQYEKAAAHVETLLEDYPDNVQAINLMSDLYAKLNRYEDAIAMIERLSAKEETAPIADLMKGSLALRQRQYDEAITLAEGALAANDDLVAAVPVIAQAYAQKGDIKSALNIVAAYLESHPDATELYDIMGRLHVGNQDYAAAIVSYERLIDLDPSQVVGYLRLIQLYNTQGQQDKALPLLDQAITSNPENIVLRAERASHFQRAGDYQKAIDELEAALEIDSGSEVAQNNLAAVLIDYAPTEQNLRRAQELTLGFESAGNPAQLDTVGWLQYRLGNIPQAISLLKAAEETGGRGPDYWYHLGMAYAANNEPEKAEEYLTKALENDQYEFFGKEAAEAELAKIKQG